MTLVNSAVLVMTHFERVRSLIKSGFCLISIMLMDGINKEELDSPFFCPVFGFGEIYLVIQFGRCLSMSLANRRECTVRLRFSRFLKGDVIS